MVSPKADFSREKRFFPEIPEQQIASAKDYYDMYLSAEQTYQKPGCPGRQTVQKLFRYWNSLHVDEYEKMPTSDRQIISKCRVITSISQILYKLNYQLNLIENQVEEERQIHSRKMENLSKNGDVDRVPYRIDVPMETLRLKVMRTILETLDMKASIEIQPTAWEVQDNHILETLQQRQEMLMKRFNRHNERKNKRNEAEKDPDSE